MMRSLLILSMLLLCTQNVWAWGKHGHEIVVEVAKRHLTERAKKNIARYMAYDITTEAVWMDKHRQDVDIAYTSHWHGAGYDEQKRYLPTAKLDKGGDVVRALQLVDYNLSHYERLTDSAVVMNLRMVLHFVGDMHCPSHSLPNGVKVRWDCTINGKESNFHSLYDRIPANLYGKKTPPAEVATKLDTCHKNEIKGIVDGSIVDWANECFERASIIFDINPFGTPVLDPNTIEKSRSLVDVQLRNAGYRLAVQLNKYFDK